MAHAKAIDIMRHDIFQENVKFEDDFFRDKKNMSIPSSMQQLVALILERSTSKSVTGKQISNNISLLLKFNCVKTNRRKVEASIFQCKNL